MGNCVLQIICNLAACVILILPYVSEATNASEPLCMPFIKVPRNTMFSAPVMSVLKINCTVTIKKCQGHPKILWCKMYGDECKALNQSNNTETEWKNITGQNGISILTFINISMEDAGLYRCKEGQTSISHAINVTVTEYNKDAHNESHNQNNTSESYNIASNQIPLLTYVYICSGIVGLVVIVITVSFHIIRCQGKKSTRKGMSTNNQCMEKQRSQSTTLSHPHHNIHSSSSAEFCTYDTSPVRTGSHRDRPPAGRVSANSTESNGCQKFVRTEEDNLLVYASLNHQAMARGQTITDQQETEFSEYAALRFK